MAVGRVQVEKISIFWWKLIALEAGGELDVPGHIGIRSDILHCSDETTSFL